MADSPFIPGTTIRWAWDSTTLKALMACPQYYKYTMIDGYRPNGSGIHLQFGALYHKALEDYHRGIVEGRDREQVIREVVRDALIGSYGMGEDKGKSRESLIRSIIWYVDKWQDDPLETLVLPSGAAAVEMSFQWQSDVPIEDAQGNPVPESADGLCYVMCGHLDRPVRWHGDALVTDYKTTGKTLSDSYFSQFTPDVQMSFYPFMANRLYGLPIRGVLIDAVQVAVTFSDYDRRVAYRTPGMLNEWWTRTQWYLRQQVTFSKTDFWPMNDTACRFCSFKSICKLDPAVRRNFLNGPAFVKQEPWNPLAARTPGEPLDLSGDSAD